LNRNQVVVRIFQFALIVAIAVVIAYGLAPDIPLRWLAVRGYGTWLGVSAVICAVEFVNQRAGSSRYIRFHC